MLTKMAACRARLLSCSSRSAIQPGYVRGFGGAGRFTGGPTEPCRYYHNHH